MKTLLGGGIVLAAVWSSFATPSVEGIRASPREGAVRVSYRLVGEPAVITLSVGVKATGAVLDDALFNTLDGDVNKLVRPGARRAFVWTKSPAFQQLGLGDDDVVLNLRAWPTNCPPDYMVVNLTNTAAAVRYYVSTNAFPAPLADIRYRTSELVMRKIHAANVEFRMGTPSDEFGYSSFNNCLGNATHAERMHWAVLSEDFYLGIYPVTYRQHCNGLGSAQNIAFWNDNRFKDVRQDDWPVCNVNFVGLRNFIHENGEDPSQPACPGPSDPAFVDYKNWYRDGHALDTNDTPRCVCRKHTSTLSFHLTTWRNRFGLTFDIPTEAQWEFACRAGTRGPSYLTPGRADSVATETGWFDALDKCAWTIRNSTNETMNIPLPHPVGQKLPNAFGLYDMLGNVGEWCVDLTGKTALTVNTVPERDPKGHAPLLDLGVSRGDAAAMRGGCWMSAPGAVRPGMRTSTCPFFSLVEFATDKSVSDSGEPNKTQRYWSMGYRLWLPATAER